MEYMEQNNEIYERIDRYLLQQMSSEEQLAFEKELSQNPDLTRELQLRKDLAGGIRLNQNKKVKERLNQIHDEITHPKTQKNASRRSLYIWSAVAASVLLLFFVYQTWLAPSVSPQDLFTEFYHSHSLNLASRSDDLDPQILQIETLFRSEQYQQVLPLIQSQLTSIESPDSIPDNIRNLKGKFLLSEGICHLELQQTDQAIASLQNLINTNDPFLIDQGYWYLALAYLQKGEVEECKTALQVLIQKSNTDHSTEARSLMELL